MKMRIWKKIITLILLVAMIGTGMSGLFEYNVSATGESAAELKQKLQDLQSQLTKLNQQLVDAKNGVSEAQVKRNTYASRVSIVKEQIETLKVSIEQKSDELAKKQEELDQKIQEHDQTYELFKSRLRAMYMNNDVSMLSLILGSKSFSEFLVAAETQSRISKHDTDLVEKLEMEAQVIETEEKLIQTELDSLEDDMTVLEDKYSELARLYQEANNELSAAKAFQQATQDDYDQIINDLQATQNEWNALMGSGMAEYVGGYYAWPTPGYSYITSGFGWRTLYGRPNYHTGIDISGSGIYGSPVIASNMGRVVRVRYYSTGYGYHVMIDHGDNQWTVYAHLSGICVNEGDWVAQGQTVGYVGSTGNSTGPHLHFEIRIDGTATNPLNYVSRG